MLDNEFQVRMSLGGDNPNAYVTDLDYQTLERANALMNATDEEKGPWMGPPGSEGTGTLLL